MRIIGFLTRNRDHLLDGVLYFTATAAANTTMKTTTTTTTVYENVKIRRT